MNQAASHIDQLTLEAAEACTNRGHVMGWEEHSFKDDNASKRWAVCLHCSASVEVRTKPMANGIDIGGSAVAVNCKRLTE